MNAVDIAMHQIDMRRFGEQLFRAIQKNFGSLVEYAEYTGQEESKVYSWCVGLVEPSLREAVVNAKILGVSLDYMFVNSVPKDRTYLRGIEVSDDNDPVVQDIDDIKELIYRINYYKPIISFYDFLLVIPLVDYRNLIQFLRFSLDLDESNNEYVYTKVQRLFDSIPGDRKGLLYLKYKLAMINSPLLTYEKKQQILRDENIIQNLNNYMSEYYDQIHHHNPFIVEEKRRNNK